jgi:hypothetical protein
LLPLSSEAISDKAEDEGASIAVSPLLQARPPSSNKSTPWAPYIVPVGKYRLVVHGEGMNEPLPVADELAIEKVQTLIFDSGL